MTAGSLSNERERPTPDSHVTRAEYEEAMSMKACPYYQGRGACSTGCHSEPACQTCEPLEGWDWVIDAWRSGRRA